MLCWGVVLLRIGYHVGLSRFFYTLVTASYFVIEAKIRSCNVYTGFGASKGRLRLRKLVYVCLIVAQLVPKLSKTLFLVVSEVLLLLTVLKLKMETLEITLWVCFSAMRVPSPPNNFLNASSIDFLCFNINYFICNVSYIQLASQVSDSQRQNASALFFRN